jgi:hypothetical protein
MYNQKLKHMKYTMEQIDQILDENGWHSCIAENEKDGKYCYGVDTLFVAQEEGQDYFGEFVGNEDDETYTFKFYV